MSNGINAHCSICGRGYHICNLCAEQKRLKPWKTIADTIDHYKIYLSLHGYTISKDKEKAKEELQHCNLSDLDNFNPEIISTINEIMAEPKKMVSISKSRKK